MKYVWWGMIGGGVVLVGIVFVISRETKVSYTSFGHSVLESVQKREPQASASGGEKNASPVTLLFGGDIMLDRYIRTTMRRFGGNFVFAGLHESLRQADMVIANLEGPISDHASESETSKVGEAKNYIFTFAPESARLLKQENISVVSLGNNHILNFGTEGVEQTKRILSEAKVDFFGSPLQDDSRILIKEVRGVKIGMVNYNQFVYRGKQKTFEDIATVKEQADVIILYTHWGQEYVPALADIKTLAHEFVDAGVDLIIGSHPHVVQEKEEYKGKMIYYSLGNLIFDQYEEEQTQRGLLVRASLDPVTRVFSFTDIPVVLKKNGQTLLETQ